MRIKFLSHTKHDGVRYAVGFVSDVQRGEKLVERGLAEPAPAKRGLPKNPRPTRRITE